MVAVIKMCGAGAGRSFADDRFVDVARVDVSERRSRRSAADWVVRDRLLVHLHIDHRATRLGSRDAASKRVVLKVYICCPVGIDVRRPKLVVRIPGEIHRGGGTGGTEVGWEGGDVSFDVGRHGLATGGQEFVRWAVRAILGGAVGRDTGPVPDGGQAPGLRE